MVQNLHLEAQLLQESQSDYIFNNSPLFSEAHLSSSKDKRQVKLAGTRRSADGRTHLSPALGVAFPLLIPTCTGESAHTEGLRMPQKTCLQCFLLASIWSLTFQKVSYYSVMNWGEKITVPKVLE